MAPGMIERTGFHPLYNWYSGFERTEVQDGRGNRKFH